MCHAMRGTCKTENSDTYTQNKIDYSNDINKILVFKNALLISPYFSC